MSSKIPFQAGLNSSPHPHWVSIGCHAIQFVSLLILTAGCGDAPESRLSLIPVTGEVRVKGQPALGSEIMLHPIGGPAADAGLYPYGIADESGTFSITSYEQGDGAPPGDYQVTVVWPDSSYQPETPAELDEFHGGGGQTPDKLRGRYAEPQGSGLKVAVTPGITELPAFDLE